MKNSIKKSKTRWGRKGFHILIMLLCGYFSWFFSISGLQELKTMRELERIPQVDFAAKIDGEGIVSGIVRSDPSSHSTTLRSPLSQTLSIYYKARVDERCENHNGDTDWCRRSLETRFVPFQIEDTNPVNGEKGSRFKVIPTDSVHWVAPRRYQKRQGRTRLTEWRIETGDHVNIIGWIQGDTVRFDVSGQYPSSITTKPIAGERKSFLYSGLFQLWLGAILAMAAILIMLFLIKVHHVVFYVLLLNGVIMVFLCFDGFTMVRHDMKAANLSLEKRFDQTRRAIHSILHKQNIAIENSKVDWQRFVDIKAVYPGLSEQNETTIRSLLTGLSYAQFQYQQQSKGFIAQLALLGVSTSNATLPEYSWLPVQDWQQDGSENSQFEWIKVLIVFILFVVFSRLSLQTIKKKRLIENIPASKAKGVLPGLVEIRGTIALPEGESPLIAPMGEPGEGCVFYRYTIKERGDDHSRGGTSHWKTAHHKQQSTRFCVKDETGQVRVDASGAELGSVMTKRHTRQGKQHIQSTLHVNDEVYILGDCQIDVQDASVLIIQKGDKSEPFMITTSSEDQLLIKTAQKSMVLLSVAFALCAMSMMGLLMLMDDFSFSDLVVSGLSAPVLALMLMGVLHYNDLIFLQHRIARNWSNVEVLLQKRWDAIAAILPVLKQYMHHEEEQLSAVAASRHSMPKRMGDSIELKRIEADQVQQIEQLVALQETYPESRSDQLVSAFMLTLSELETEISLVRAGYNDAAEIYNTRIESFPDLLIAWAFVFKRVRYEQWD